MGLGQILECGQMVFNQFSESIADDIRQPLYTITSGELGSTTALIQENLSAALELATTWNAIVLLDEADVFLEQRSPNDLERNALVSGKAFT